MDRMSRVVAMLSDRRSIVAMQQDGREGREVERPWIHSATIRISTESAIEKARPISIRTGRQRQEQHRQDEDDAEPLNY